MSTGDRIPWLLWSDANGWSGAMSKYCDCGATDEGKWAGVHSPNCSSLPYSLANLFENAHECVLGFAKNDEIQEYHLSDEQVAMIVDALNRQARINRNLNKNVQKTRNRDMVIL